MRCYKLQETCRLYLHFKKCSRNVTHNIKMRTRAATGGTYGNLPRHRFFYARAIWSMHPLRVVSPNATHIFKWRTVAPSWTLMFTFFQSHDTFNVFEYFCSMITKRHAHCHIAHQARSEVLREKPLERPLASGSAIRLQPEAALAFGWCAPNATNLEFVKMWKITSNAAKPSFALRIF